MRLLFWIKMKYQGILQNHVNTHTYTPTNIHLFPHVLIFILTQPHFLFSSQYAHSHSYVHCFALISTYILQHTLRGMSPSQMCTQTDAYPYTLSTHPHSLSYTTHPFKHAHIHIRTPGIQNTDPSLLFVKCFFIEFY